MKDNPWENVFQDEGHVFQDIPEVIPEFSKLLSRYSHHKRLLDVGCGNGRFLVYFSDLGYEVTGLDSAPTALHLSQEWLARTNHTGDLLQADGRQPFPFKDDSFDILISTQVIHHALKQTVLSTIDEITRIVRPAGWILISVPVYRKMEALSDSIEVEYHTFIPQSGQEKGLPHHLFTLEEFGACFSSFHIHLLESRDNVVIVLMAQKR